MKITLHLATSADGFIAKPNGDSDWVDPQDETLFEKRVQDAGCLVVGRKTFEQYKGTIYPIDGAINIVLTNQQLEVPNALTANTPERAVKLAEENGCNGILIAGGSMTSNAFLESNLIDEIYFSVHPLILGKGINPFSDTNQTKINFLGSRKLENGLVELHYSVTKI